MKKTEANVRLLVETVLSREDYVDTTGFNVEVFTQNYLSGEEYEPKTEGDEEILSILEEVLHNEFDRHQPTENEQWEADAPKIPVKLGGKIFQTFIDKNGVQRFCGNSVITELMSNNDSNPQSPTSLNKLAIDYHTGKYSSEDWLDFMTSFGYSVSGLMDLTEFTYLPIENPLWDEPSE
jgi:hypothetical protein